MSAEEAAAENLSHDTLLGGRVRLSQPARGYRVAIDPVFLAAAVPVRPGETVLDVGAGVGAAALCLAARQPAARVAGIEVRSDLVRLAVHNANASGLRVDFMAGDLKHAPARLAAGSFDHVMANPPFLEAGRANPAADAGKRLATVEGTPGLAAGLDAGLDNWLDFALLMARSRGSVTIIHRADRLDDVLAAMKGRLGAVGVFPLWPGPAATDEGAGVKAAKRILVSGVKGLKTPMRLLPGLVLHGPGGAYTPQAEGVLRHAQGLDKGLDMGPDGG